MLKHAPDILFGVTSRRSRVATRSQIQLLVNAVRLPRHLLASDLAQRHEPPLEHGRDRLPRGALELLQQNLALLIESNGPSGHIVLHMYYIGLATSRLASRWAGLTPTGLERRPNARRLALVRPG